MRLFIAVNLPEETKEKLSETLQGVRRLAETAGSRVKWVTPEQMHLTLKFLGECTETQVPHLVKALVEAAEGVQPFSLTLNGFGCFPPRVTPKVLWVGCAEGGKTLTGLAGKIDSAFEPLNFPKESRPYNPHLTLGRVQFAGHGDRLRSQLAALRPAPIGPIPVESLDLVQSVLTSAGSRYTTLQRVGLKKT